ncbi:lariat debranching enzyme, C-terminal domain-containing protein [Panaeolus papilionaceus]|nr:lariat debranching enzyme, C-terminal domain-containing protein [Panaeolus papilionaceus]
MKIAVQGCCHGELDAIYKHIGVLESQNGYKVDLLLICGDFQAIRNHRDLQCMSVPNKYKELRQFYKYYTGEATAPLLTIVIGGNHEASNYMWELYHGGWLAPNIYFLGHAGCVRVNGIRIAGASGIFKGHDFRLGHYEKLPYDSGSMRSIYHIREYSVRKLSLLSSIKIFLSHDWPQSIEHHGDVAGLLRRKQFFRADIDNGTLGSPPLMGLLRTLQPDWWFAAHLHTRFEACVVHQEGNAPAAQSAPLVENPDEIKIDDDEFDDVEDVKQAAAPAKNPDEITIDDDEFDDVQAVDSALNKAEEANSPQKPAEFIPRKETKFLALDKCLPRRQFLEVIDIESDDTPSGDTLNFSFDPEWLAICRAFHPLLSTTRHQPAFPDEADARNMVARELDWVSKNIKTDASGEIPISDYQTFVMTAPGPGTEGQAKFQQPPWFTNSQTESFCRMLGVPNKINPPPST